MTAVADFRAACGLYQELRDQGLGTQSWNEEVALAWLLIGEMARACAIEDPPSAAVETSARRLGVYKRERLGES